MTSARDADLGESDLAAIDWLTITHHFGDLLALLRALEPLRSIDGGPWSVLVTMTNLWRSGVSPGADELAAASGWSRRSVFRYVGVLLDAGVVRAVGARYNRGYGVGTALGPILRTFVSDREVALWRWEMPRFDATLAPAPGPSASVAPGAEVRATQARTSPTSRASVARARTDSRASVARGASPRQNEVRTFLLSSPAVTPTASPTAPPTDSSSDATRASSFLIKNKKLTSSSSFSEAEPVQAEPSPRPQTSPPPPPGPPSPTTSREIACRALTALHRQVRPTIPLPRSFDAGDIAMVERCSANGTGDAAALEQMHLDAIASACRTSSGPPTASYIWGQFGHFIEHVRKGQAERLRAQPRRPKPKPREPEEPMAAPEWVAAHVGEVLARLGRPPESKPSPQGSSH